MATQTGLADYIKRGAHDDGGEGYVRTAQRNSHLIERPFSSTSLTSTAGTATALNTGGSAVNTDGTSSAAFLSVNAGVGNVALIRDTIHGRVLGIRVARNSTTTQAPFTVVCDGVPYYVADVRGRRNTATASAPDDNADWIILDRDLLHDGPHTVTVVLNPDVTGGVTRTVTLFGWVTDSSHGHAQRARGGYLGTAGLTLTTSFQNPVASGPVRKLMFNNNDSVAHVVTIKASNNKVRDVTVPAAGGSPSADGYAEHDFGQPVGGWGSMSVAVDGGGTAGKVTMWTQQGDVK